jgi:nucleotide-binding universal stress UspA family protein
LTPDEQRQLHDMVQRCVHGKQVSVVVGEGSPAEEIVAQAKRLSADLIVIGTHGRKGLKHLLLGSVAERVLRSSPIPVLTLRKPGATQED